MATPKLKADRTGGPPRPTQAASKQPTALLVNPAGGPGPGSVAITVRSKTFRTLASQSGSVRALIESYGAALEQSRRSGRQVRFVVDVAPQGAATITPLEAPQPAELPETAPTDDLEAALAAARARGQSRVAEILRGPDMLSADAFAELIGTSRVTVNAKRQARQVLALEGAKRGYRFPQWQVGEDGKPFAALPQLFARLGESSWAVYRFLVQHHPELDGQTGQEALLGGRVAAVLEAAEGIARGDFA